MRNCVVYIFKRLEFYKNFFRILISLINLAKVFVYTLSMKSDIVMDIHFFMILNYWTPNNARYVTRNPVRTRGATLYVGILIFCSATAVDGGSGKRP